LKENFKNATFLLPGTPFSESALSECVLESELDVDDESSSSGSSLVSELSSNILYGTYDNVKNINIFYN